MRSPYAKTVNISSPTFFRLSTLILLLQNIRRVVKVFFLTFIAGRRSPFSVTTHKLTESDADCVLLRFICISFVVRLTNRDRWERSRDFFISNKHRRIFKLTRYIGEGAGNVANSTFAFCESSSWKPIFK